MSGWFLAVHSFAKKHESMERFILNSNSGARTGNEDMYDGFQYLYERLEEWGSRSE